MEGAAFRRYYFDLPADVADAFDKVVKEAKPKITRKGYLTNLVAAEIVRVNSNKGGTKTKGKK